MGTRVTAVTYAWGMAFTEAQRSAIVRANKSRSKGGYVDGKATRLYKLWLGIKIRCLYPSSSGFKYYGGRGIKIHGPWVDDFVGFREWIVTNIGEPVDGQSLDRINNDGNYEPGNLRWASHREQCRNRRPTKKRHIVILKHPVTGAVRSLQGWAEFLGVKCDTLDTRRRRGRTVEEILAPDLKRGRRPRKRAPGLSPD